MSETVAVHQRSRKEEQTYPLRYMDMTGSLLFSDIRLNGRVPILDSVYELLRVCLSTTLIY